MTHEMRNSALALDGLGAVSMLLLISLLVAENKNEKPAMAGVTAQ